MNNMLGVSKITENGQEIDRLAKIAGLQVEKMHVAVGNIYRCEDLDGWHWMYELTCINKLNEYINR